MSRRTGVVQRIEPVVVFANPFPLRHHTFAGQKLLCLPLRSQMLGE